MLIILTGYSYWHRVRLSQKEAPSEKQLRAAFLTWPQKKMSPKSINPFLLVHPPYKLHRYCRVKGPTSSSPFDLAPFPNISSKGLEWIQQEIFSLSNYFLLETD